MNVHGALNHRVWRVGVHHVEDGMNHFIALDPQESRYFSFRRPPKPFSRDLDCYLSWRSQPVRRDAYTKAMRTARKIRYRLEWLGAQIRHETPSAFVAQSNLNSGGAGGFSNRATKAPKRVSNGSVCVSVISSSVLESVLTAARARIGSQLPSDR
jgi:hypothetical protein